jgi:hypothetical protein
MKLGLTSIGLCMVCMAAGCGDSKSPTTPSPPANPTRIIGLSGNLAFGDVETGTSKDAQLTISNSGTATLTVTGMTGPSGYTASWTGGTILAGGSQPVNVRFSPTAEQTYNGTLTVNADQTSGANTLAVSGRGVRAAGPRTQFGVGLYAVGSEIVPGRYFSVPRTGCYWERLSGLGGSTGEIIGNEFIGSNVGQWIVDIQGTDKYFRTSAECGTWFNSPRTGLQASISPGVWLVPSQITPGIYRANVSANCYWERKRSFFGTGADIIDNDFLPTAQSTRTEVRASDAGFQSDNECGTWTLDSGATAPEGGPGTSPGAIDVNRYRHREKAGLR